MFCPRCGQQQTSSEIHFCSRCGLQISGVRNLLNNYQQSQLQPVSQMLPQSPRKKGIKFGAKLLFASIAITPILFGIAIAVDNPAPLILPFTLFVGGILKMLYARIFEDELPKLALAAERPAPPLYPPQRVSLFDQDRVDTAEMIPPSERRGI